MTQFGLDLQRRSGWFRIWAIAALCWVGFAISQLTPPWTVPQFEAERRAIEVGQDDAVEIAKVMAAIDASVWTDCQAQIVESRPIERSSNLKDFLRKREGTQAGPDSELVREVRVLCEPAGRAMEQWAIALASGLGPPILVPLGFWLAFRLGLWILAGFRPSPSGSDSYPAPKMRVVRTKSHAGAVSQEAELQANPEGASQLAKLRSWLSWSVLIAAVIDIFARASVSNGKSHGTNLLLFAIIAFAAYFIAKLIDRLRRLSTDLPIVGLSIFWMAALGLISFTTARY